ncbi:MAG: HlyD family efflux transporter periplasmic adaptor subunit [Clostridiales bacterium]|jgi:multidrug efflux pump subunit AcrA (membrane-fusion protein)|nr:HlyD family efflux transporter periplasmic adaptor subunit [Clostridiales bacterium]
MPKTKKKKTKRNIIIGIVALIIVILIVSVFTRGSGGNYSQETAQIRDVVTYYAFSGNIDADNKQNLTATSTISIDKILVREGDYVREGDTLYTLDDSDVVNNVAASEANVEVARISYEKAQGATQTQTVMQAQIALSNAVIAFNDAELNFNRVNSLFENGAATSQAVEQAHTAYENAKNQLELSQVNFDTAMLTAQQTIQTAKAQYEQAKANYQNSLNLLDNRRIKAKVSGIVADVYVQDNFTPSMGDKIMDIVDYNSLILKIDVDEYDIGIVDVDKEVEIVVNSLETEITGVISKISNQAKKSGDLSYFTATIAIGSVEGLRVGLSVEARVPNISRLGVVTLSVDAIQYDIVNNPFVYVGVKNNPTRRDIEIGKNDGVIIEILSGVSDGEIVYIPQTGMGAMMNQQPEGATQLRREVNRGEGS